MMSSSSMPAPAPGSGAHEVLLVDHCVSVGRPLALIILPALDSVLDTVFWGDGYKSLAHIVFLSFLWWRGACGVRAMVLLLWFHVIASAVAASRQRRRDYRLGNGDMSASEVIERRRAQRAFRNATVFLAKCIHRVPLLFFVAPASMRRRVFHSYVAGLTGLLCWLLFPQELNALLRHVGVLNEADLPSLFSVLDAVIAPLTVLVIVLAGAGRFGPQDPRYIEGGSVPAMGETSSAAPSGAKPERAPLAYLSRQNTADDSDAASSPRKRDSDSALFLAATGAQGTRTVGGSFADRLLPDVKGREEILTALLAALNPRGGRGFWPAAVPDGPWDTAVPRYWTLPQHAHRILAILTHGPDWATWKRFSACKTAQKAAAMLSDKIAEEEAAEDDIIAASHPVSFSGVKCGYNRVRLRGVSFDEVVGWLTDDGCNEDGTTKDTKELNIWRFDGLLSEYRRLAYASYSLQDEGVTVTTTAKVVHYLYKQIVFGIAARDVPMFTTTRELTEREIRHYNLFEEHHNTFFPARARANKDTAGTIGAIGRVFLVSSAPVDELAPVPAHVRGTIHRHAMLVIAPPAVPGALATCPQVVDVATVMCGEPGGKIPMSVADIARGEQVKVVRMIREAVLKDNAKKEK